MNSKFVFPLTLLLVTLFSQSSAQQLENNIILEKGRSIDVPTDPHGIAMGESFVSLPNNNAAMFYNPAGLAGLPHVSFTYSRRAMDWLSGMDMKYYSFAATIPTSFVNIGLLYNRFSMGELMVTTNQNPEGDGTTISMYDHTIGVGLAKQYDDHLSFGLSVKTFNSIAKVQGPSAGSANAFAKTTQLPVLFDFGILYVIPFNDENSSFLHQLNLGLSVQNIGSALKQERQTTILATQATSRSTITMPHYLRLGFSYCYSMHGDSFEALDPISVHVAGEYKNAANSRYARKDYWGFGIGVTVFEIASVRIGGTINPYTSIYGNEGAAAARYGFGLHAPLKKLGAGIPIVIDADYTSIPVNDIPFFSQKKKSLAAFSLGIQYEYELF
ncbi:MAG: PorV/PorQ family protein [Bacteroidetes bacterium]|nr:PorV/PorQ family protein [Bacteroidota bacterium]MCW5894190.1 PorV/PorQ family protein [Bacteroidota bacterium]